MQHKCPEPALAHSRMLDVSGRGFTLAYTARPAIISMQHTLQPCSATDKSPGSPFETRHLLGLFLGVWQTPQCEAHHSFHTPIHEDTMLPKAMPAAQPRGADTGAPLACANPQQLPRPVTYLPRKRQNTCVHVLCQVVGAANENRRHCSAGAYGSKRRLCRTRRTQRLRGCHAGTPA